jgi:hypothetical protein
LAKPYWVENKLSLVIATQYRLKNIPAGTLENLLFETACGKLRIDRKFYESCAGWREHSC